MNGSRWNVLFYSIPYITTAGLIISEMFEIVFSLFDWTDSIKEIILYVFRGP